VEASKFLLKHQILLNEVKMSKKNKTPMNEETFNNRKKYLLEEIDRYISENKHKDFVIKLKNILDRYTYNNRLDEKGFLGHVIVDQTPDFKDPLFNAISDFDYKIS
jgi:hypothetical protein